MVEFSATATKVDAPKVTERQLALTGSVRCVQVMPSAEVAAMVELITTATKVDAPKVTDSQLELTGSVRCVQVMPLASAATTIEVPAAVMLILLGVSVKRFVTFAPTVTDTGAEAKAV